MSERMERLVENLEAELARLREENARLRTVVEAARLVNRYVVVNEIAARAMSHDAMNALTLLDVRLDALAKAIAKMAEPDHPDAGWGIYADLIRAHRVTPFSASPQPTGATPE